MINPVYLVAIPLIVIVLAMVFGYFLPGFKRRRHMSSPIALAPFGRDKSVIPPRPIRISEETAAVSPAAAAAPAAAVPTPPVEVPVPRATTAMDAVVPEARARAREVAEEQPRVFKLQASGDVRPSPPSTAATLRLEKPVDGTLQFLPGKLEVIEGRNIGQELRFVKTAGPDGQSVTFGRNEGPQYRHVQLEEHTVSRMHAKMTLDGKAWTLTNLSRTNPAIVNGLPLGEDNPSVVLRDGDRIELGEVILRFRNR